MENLSYANAFAMETQLPVLYCLDSYPLEVTLLCPAAWALYMCMCVCVMFVKDIPKRLEEAMNTGR